MKETVSTKRVFTDQTAGTMRLFRGIRFQLVAGIVLTTLAAIGLIGVFSLKVIESRALFWKIDSAENTARFVRSALRAAVTEEDARRTFRFIGGGMREAGIVSYRLTDPSGRVVLKEGVIPREEGALVTVTEDLRVRRIGGGFFDSLGTALYVSSVLDTPLRKGWSVEFVLGVGDIKEDLASVRKFLVFYAALDSVIIVILGAYLLSRSIIGPVKKLDEVSTRIAGGRLWERADVRTDNEIGSLAVSFNVMAERLEEEIKALERVNKELMAAQEELTRSRTLAAVGRLAAGIAHEIGNPLGAVSGYLEILKGSARDGEEREMIERTALEVARIDAMVREFLDMSRPPRKPPEPVEVNAVLEEALSAFSVHRGASGVEVKRALSEGLPRAEIEDGKLRQVFMNLLLNAAQSTEGRDGRLIEVSTSVEERPAPPPRRRKDDPPLMHSRPEADMKRYVIVEVKDNGRGVREEDMNKVFEPFFTTKDVGRGTGLGLFVSRSIIKAYGGDISFTSREGEGSSFKVALPAGGSW